MALSENDGSSSSSSSSSGLLGISLFHELFSEVLHGYVDVQEEEEEEEKYANKNDTITTGETECDSCNNNDTLVRNHVRRLSKDGCRTTLKK